MISLCINWLLSLLDRLPGTAANYNERKDIDSYRKRAFSIFQRMPKNLSYKNIELYSRQQKH